MNKYIYLFRHTQSQDNKDGIFSGDRRDVSLSKEGEMRAYELKDQFKNINIDIGISSPLKRSIETLDIVLEGKENVERIIDERIKERDYGILEGKEKKNITFPLLSIWAKLAYRSYTIPPPGGENFRQVWKRVTPFVYDLIDLVRTKNINVAICAHNNSMRPIRAHFEYKTPQQMLKENSEPGKVYKYTIPV
jgi:broad specificity phosphatase PhoE